MLDLFYFGLLVFVVVVGLNVWIITKRKDLGAFLLKFWHRIIGNPVNAGWTALLVAGVVVFLASRQFYKPEYWEGVSVEAHGMIMDIVVLGIFVLWLNKRGEKRALIQRYEDEIDDLREWDDKEAMHRIVGNIKRLSRFKIRYTNLYKCYLQNANFRYANLSGAELQYTDLQDANLRNASLLGANLRNANLRNASLNQADLQFAFIHQADLQGADLREAKLWNTDLRGANLCDANLQGANFQSVNLWAAAYSPATIFPDNFTIPYHDMFLVEDEPPNQQPSTTTKPHRVESLPSYNLPC